LAICQTLSTREAYWREGFFYKRTTVWPFDDNEALEEIRKSL
jgi:hypothetical protein